jgi:hypothetical protein
VPILSLSGLVDHTGAVKKRSLRVNRLNLHSETCREREGYCVSSILDRVRWINPKSRMGSNPERPSTRGRPRAVDMRTSRDFFGAITNSTPSGDVLKSVEAVGPDQGRPLVMIGERGQGKSHLMAVLDHAFNDPTATQSWLAEWGDRLGNSKISALPLRESGIGHTSCIQAQRPSMGVMLNTQGEPRDGRAPDRVQYPRRPGPARCSRAPGAGPKRIPADR